MTKTLPSPKLRMRVVNIWMNLSVQNVSQNMEEFPTNPIQSSGMSCSLTNNRLYNRSIFIRTHVIMMNSTCERREETILDSFLIIGRGEFRLGDSDLGILNDFQQ